MQQNNKWKKELDTLKTILNTSGLVKATKWGTDVYTYNGRNVASCGGFKNYCSIWFYNGVFMKDKYHVLITASGGKTKSLRQWRFYSEKEIEEKKIREYIREAIEIEKKNLRVPPEKFKPIPPPPILANALQQDKKLKAAFYLLTPGKQKEYSLYLNEARQEKTQLARLERIMPMILDGIGLNDKYRKK